eukprot:scaffold959_cov171-Ochromonas_danica.AAC.1
MLKELFSFVIHKKETVAGIRTCAGMCTLLYRGNLPGQTAVCRVLPKTSNVRKPITPAENQRFPFLLVHQPMIPSNQQRGTQ